MIYNGDSLNYTYLLNESNPLQNIMEMTQHIYYNEEWNPRGTQLDDDDSGHEDFVDVFHPPKVDTTYYDDYDDYGN